MEIMNSLDYAKFVNCGLHADGRWDEQTPEVPAANLGGPRSGGNQEGQNEHGQSLGQRNIISESFLSNLNIYSFLSVNANCLKYISNF